MQILCVRGQVLKEDRIGRAVGMTALPDHLALLQILSYLITIEGADLEDVVYTEIDGTIFKARKEHIYRLFNLSSRWMK